MFPVAVVGAGPAGALAARQLARYGVRALLVQGRRRFLHHLGESLATSSVRLLASYGLELPSAVFAPRPPDHIVRWGGREDRIAAQPESGEGQRLVRRDRLDAWAVEAAARAGAEVLPGSAQPDGPERIRVGGRRIEAGILVDATGRRGALTRDHRIRPGFRTTALTAHFRPGPRNATLVASFERGWLWTAPIVGRRRERDVTVMVDAGDARSGFEDALRQVDLDGFVVGGPLGPARAADVTPYRLDTDAPALAVGDAWSALDPLTGQGALKAMDSGLTAAVAIRTALERPECAELAFRYCRLREAGLARDAEERIGATYAAETRYAEAPFWRARSRPPRPPPPAGGGTLEPAPGAGVATEGVLRGDWIVPATVVARPGRRPVHRFRGIALAPVFRNPVGSDPDAVAFLVREGFLRARS